MSLNLPLPSLTYDPRGERQRNRSLEIADRQNRKSGQDVEIAGEQLILQSPNGQRWALTIDDLGALGTTAL